MERYSRLAVTSQDDFLYGTAPRPLRLKNGMVIGGGQVYPELNFTLPPMEITADTMPEVRSQYAGMIEEACRRAVELNAPGLVVEFELLPPMTLNPEWGAEVTAILRETLDHFAASDGLRGALRVTPNDIREHERPPRMRGGHLWESMTRSFELCAAAGADMLSIESTGGKEVHDDAVLNADVAAAAYSLGVMGARDMAFLWDMIVAAARRHGAVPAGDSACGFGNTAMVLAEKRYIPRVWAAIIRVMTVARSLVAFERGAVGPSKDCAYEGPYIKAITGYPISMEGSQAACAHLSPVGNISQALADLWSNESVQNVRLLGGMAPTVSLEQLVYAARLMNTASAGGPEQARLLQQWLVESDARFDPQAYVLRPDVVLELASAIVEEPTPYLRVRRGAAEAARVLRSAHSAGRLEISDRDAGWLDMLSEQIDALPDTEDELEAMVRPGLDPGKVLLEEYAPLEGSSRSAA